jgi:hypothetical protein
MVSIAIESSGLAPARDRPLARLAAALSASPAALPAALPAEIPVALAAFTSAAGARAGAGREAEPVVAVEDEVVEGHGVVRTAGRDRVRRGSVVVEPQVIQAQSGTVVQGQRVVAAPRRRGGRVQAGARVRERDLAEVAERELRGLVAECQVVLQRGIAAAQLDGAAFAAQVHLVEVELRPGRGVTGELVDRGAPEQDLLLVAKFLQLAGLGHLHDFGGGLAELLGGFLERVEKLGHGGLPGWRA